MRPRTSQSALRGARRGARLTASRPALSGRLFGPDVSDPASVAGLRGGGLSGTAAYAASKGAVLALTKNAARALAERGISVNTVGTHLRAVFATLDVQSRVQLANSLHAAETEISS